MDVDRALADEESRRDVTVGATLGQDVQHLLLAWAESVDVGRALAQHGDDALLDGLREVVSRRAVGTSVRPAGAHGHPSGARTRTHGHQRRGRLRRPIDVPTAMPIAADGSATTGRATRARAARSTTSRRSGSAGRSARDVIGLPRGARGSLASRLAIVLASGAQDGQRLPPARLGFGVGHGARAPGRRQPVPRGRVDVTADALGVGACRRQVQLGLLAGAQARRDGGALDVGGSLRAGRAPPGLGARDEPGSLLSRPCSAAAAAASRQVEAAQATTASSSLSRARGHSRSAMPRAPAGSRAQSATLTAERRTWPVHWPGGTVSSCSSV